MNGGMQALASAKVGALSPRPHARVAAGDAMWKVVAEMKTQGRGAVLVEDDGVLVGIFTERDLLNRIDHSDTLWSHVVVRDVMTPQPMVIRAADSLSEALRRLTQGHRRHLPIVDDRGHVAGLISIRDILTFIAERFPDDMMNLPPHPDHES
ncbi:MAG: CBS domain-containing protein [Myxococcales bacterium]|nr:CBS domain-containing protein [Myxococcales bacterium]